MSEHNPPRLPLRFFRWFCHPDYVEDIEGDLLERFEKRVEENGLRNARWLFSWEVLRLLRSGLMKPAGGIRRLNNFGVFQTYWKVAYRNLWKSRAYSVSNIVGLTLAFAVVLIILLHIQFESSYDDFHAKKDQLFRVETETFQYELSRSKSATTFTALGPDAVNEIPGLERYVRLTQEEDGLIATDDLFHRVHKITYVDPGFLRAFSFGNLDPTALDEPNSIVLTRSLAQKLFGDTDPVGHTIRFQFWGASREIVPLLVTGVIGDPPKNSHLDFELLISYSTLPLQFIQYSWSWPVGVHTYLILSPETSPKTVETQLAELIEKKRGEEMQAEGLSYAFHLRPIKDIHLGPALFREMKAGGSPRLIQFLLVAALMIMAISWLNSINLAHVRNFIRTGEIGIRKVLGASRLQIFNQLLVESLLSALIALSLALVSVILVGRYVEAFLGISLRYDFLFSLRVLGLILLITISGSIASSVDLTSLGFRFFKKGSLVDKPGKGSEAIRKLGIITQFGITLVMIVVTISVHKQLSFINSFDLGIDKERSVVVDASCRQGKWNEIVQSTKLFKSTVEQQSWVNAMAVCNGIPGSEAFRMGNFRILGDPMTTGAELAVVAVEGDYLKALGLHLVAGSDGSHLPNLLRDSLFHVILNEAAVKKLGFASNQEAVGKLLFDYRNQNRYRYHVLGVVENYNHESLRHEIPPLMIRYNECTEYFVINLSNSQGISDQLETIESAWSAIHPGIPFDFFFLDDHINAQYESDRKFGRFFMILSGVGIFIACIGMFSLSSFYATRRIKEVGIRKVLGAGVRQVVWLLSSQFILLTLIGLCISMPIAHYSTSSWLQNFAFRVEISWIMFLGVAFAVLLLSTAVVITQTARAASVNPSECLRNE